MAITWREVLSAPATQVILETPCGPLGVSGQGNLLRGLAWKPGGQGQVPSSPLPVIVGQLRTYFHCPETEFECDLALRGTPFQRRVWQRLLEIPPGQVITYGDLAGCLGTSPRAVAAACRANPYPLVIPCHRVVSRSGLGGYGGQTQGAMPAIKRWLLSHEGGDG